MAKLVCRAGPDAGHEYPVSTEKMVFGRRSTADVQIRDSMASREHFVIRKEGRLYTLSDLESRNGTRLNGRKITERQLEFGDVISVGEVEWLMVKEAGDVELKDLLTEKYEISEKIGEGGMGIVFRAVQRSMDRTVALKILSPKYAARPKFVNHFIEEARAAGRLNHPNIIQVHDVDTENGIHYFSMEFVEGATCMQMLRSRGPFPVTEALEITRLTAKALQYAHEQRIIHRDVKPDNIMVGPNNIVKLADLGISKTFDEAAAEDSVKRIVGTPHYMAPEAAKGQRIDHRIDIYSLGATLHQLLTGKPLFPGLNATDLLKAHIGTEPPPASSVTPGTPKVVEDLVLRMVAKQPDERHASAEVVIHEIERLQNEHGLAPELPTHGETQMLRRFAAGKSGTPSEVRTPEPEPRPARTGSRTATGPAPRRRSGGGGAVKFLLVLIILGLLGALGYQMRDQIRDRLLGNGSQRPPPVDQPNGPIQPSPDQAQQNPPPTRPPETDPQAVARDRELGRYERMLRTNLDDAGLKEIRSGIDRLSLATSDAKELSRIDRIRGLLATASEQLRLQDETQVLEKLRVEIEALLGKDDYDGALDRLKVHAGSSSTAVKEQVKDLQGYITRQRDGHINRLQTKMKRLSIRADATGLRELKASLPPSLLDDAIAEEIQQAINIADDKVFSKFSGILDSAAKALASWDFAEVRRIHAEHDGRIPAKELTATLQAYKQAADTLVTLQDRLNKAVAKKGDVRIRYEGIIQNIPEPLLIGASAEGVTLKISTGTATAGFARMSKNEYAQVLMKTIGSIPADLKKALNTFFSARGH